MASHNKRALKIRNAIAEALGIIAALHLVAYALIVMYAFATDMSALLFLIPVTLIAMIYAGLANIIAKENEAFCGNRKTSRI